ncbi:MAG: hypothetical protein SFU83_19545 [Meiothermus sp.]|nr:hypothetical protein [Meiothermus sp.]
MAGRTWQDAVSVGVKGEALARDVLIPRLYPGAHIEHITAVGDQKWLHADFAVTGAKQKLFLEVKADAHRTGNIVAETHLNYVTGRVSPGWLYKSKADVLLYVMLAFNKAYVIDMADLRLRCMQKQYTMKKTTLKGHYDCFFYLIPEAELVDAGYRVLTFDKEDVQ